MDNSTNTRIRRGQTWSTWGRADIPTSPGEGEIPPVPPGEDEIIPSSHNESEIDKPVPPGEGEIMS